MKVIAMKKTKWYEILSIILLCIIFSPVILFVLIIVFFQKVVPAPFEYRKYKKSKYYSYYKKKYKIGITSEANYILQNELLESDIHLEEIRKPYGYTCLLSENYCFGLFEIDNLKIDDNIQIKLRKNSVFVNCVDFIEDEMKYFSDECINRKFMALIYNDDEHYDSILSEDNIKTLRENCIIFYKDEEELARILKEILSINK